MPKKKNKISAYDRVLDLIGNRDYSVSELRSKLKQKGYPEGEINSALKKAEEFGYLNDIRFAVNWVKNRKEKKLASKRRLLMELWQRGISKEIAQRALEESYDSSEVEIVVSILKNWLEHDKEPSKKTIVKWYQRIVRRQFPSYIIKEAFDICNLDWRCILEYNKSYKRGNFYNENINNKNET